MDTDIDSLTPAPVDYPLEPAPDQYNRQVFAKTFAERRKAFLEFVLKNPAPESVKAAWFELARLSAGGAPHVGVFNSAFKLISERQTNADYALHALLRLQYQFEHHQRVHPDVLDQARSALLSFKYWPDEPGSSDLCFWTEHHYLLFTSAGYLAGRLFPEEIFTNSGLTGAELAAVHKERLLTWLSLRFFTGFSEWLSNLTFDPVLAGLINLVDFSRDPEIKERAAIIADLLLFEVAANSFHGVFGSTHGISDEPAAKWAFHESTSDTLKLLFGKGCYSGADNMSAPAIALSHAYRLPTVIEAVAQDDRPEMLHRQRSGICVDQADWWDIQPVDFEKGLHLLTLEAYFHPRTANLFLRMMDAFDLWENENFQMFAEKRSFFKTFKRIGLLRLLTKRYQRDLGRMTREEVNVYTYRTPDMMLSSAVDYRKGYGGSQQHIWQATLGPDAVCFTTHPARTLGAPPNYWTGSGILPRVAQIKNVLIAIYRLDKFPALLVEDHLRLTHAWLPRDRYEEVVEQDGWIFARYGDGYLALLSEHPYEWRELPGEDSGREVLVNSSRNIWLCELGRREIDGDFEDFVQRIIAAEVQFSGSNVTYHSPSQGKIEFGWDRPLRKDGRVIRLDDYPRYANPYAQSDLPSEEIHIELNEHSLDLEWTEPRRNASGYVE